MGGQGVAVFEREKMLAGQAARMIYFDKASDASLGGMLPSDLDGQAPPAGAPNVFLQFDDSPDRCSSGSSKRTGRTRAIDFFSGRPC